MFTPTLIRACVSVPIPGTFDSGAEQWIEQIPVSVDSKVTHVITGGAAKPIVAVQTDHVVEIIREHVMKCAYVCSSSFAVSPPQGPPPALCPRSLCWTTFHANQSGCHTHLRMLYYTLLPCSPMRLPNARVRPPDTVVAHRSCRRRRTVSSSSTASRRRKNSRLVLL